MKKIKVIDSKFIKKSNNTNIYKLLTEFSDIILRISVDDIEKETIIKYIKCPFYLVLDQSINQTISENDYFEVSTCESTIDLECNPACGIALR